MSVIQFLAGLEELRKIDSEMQAQTMAIYLAVMKKPGISMRELETATGHASSTISRNIAALGKIHRKGKPGHQLLSSKEDPMDRRIKRVFPTAKGHYVYKAFREAVGDTQPLD